MNIVWKMNSHFLLRLVIVFSPLIIPRTRSKTFEKNRILRSLFLYLSIRSIVITPSEKRITQRIHVFPKIENTFCKKQAYLISACKYKDYHNEKEREKVYSSLNNYCSEQLVDRNLFLFTQCYTACNFTDSWQSKICQVTGHQRIKSISG